MWMCDTRILCKNHLLGEHNEIHKFLGTINAGYQYSGYMKGMIEIHNIPNRHAALVEEMSRRGYNHKSPLPTWFSPWYEGYVPQSWALDDLIDRCPECRRNFEELLDSGWEPHFNDT